MLGEKEGREKVVNKCNTNMIHIENEEEKYIAPVVFFCNWS